MVAKSRPMRPDTGALPLPILASMLKNVLENLALAGVDVRVASWQNSLLLQLVGWGQCPQCGAFPPDDLVTASGCPECAAR